MNEESCADILVIGEALVDIFSDAAGRHEAFGGSPANTALALGRLGHRVRLATALGVDQRGDALRAWLAESGVRVHATDIPRTATAEATLARDGSAAYSFDIAWDVTLAALAPAMLVHTGSIATGLEPGAAAVEQYLRKVRTTATVSVDPNIRPALVGSEQKDRIQRVLGLADVIKLSDEDLSWLAPDSSLEAAARHWLAKGASLVVVTRGARGALGFSRRAVVACDAPVVEVVDTVAAGDTFAAALLDGLTAERLIGADQRDALRQISETTLTRVLAHAARAAAITVGRRGANPPTRAELVAP